jgi:RNA polymerase sigma factor (sigma-70 family)
MNESQGDCRKILLKFEKENPELIKSPVFTSFIADKENKELYEKAICFRSSDTIKKLETNFRKHYFNLRFTSYLSTTIHFNAINFDKRERKFKERAPLVLNSLSKGESDLTLLEIIPDQSRVSNPEAAFEDGFKRLEDLATEEELYEAICTLTPKQKDILTLAYIEGLNDTDIAKSLEITQQAVSKSHQKALLKLRAYLS